MPLRRFAWDSSFPDRSWLINVARNGTVLQFFSSSVIRFFGSGARHHMGMRWGIALLVVGTVCAMEVPSGTHIEIRLTGAVNTATAKVDQPVDAVVIVPVVAANQIVVAAGVKVKGHIEEVKAAVNPDDQAVLGLVFDQIGDARGKKAVLAARLVGVDNARESVDKDGRILGIIASQTGSGRLDQGINKVTEKYSSLGELLGTIKQAVLKPTDANIDYEPGVEMTIELTKPLTWTGDARGPNVRAVEPQNELASLVNEQPFRTRAAKPPRESDITNIMFLGSRQKLENAFQAAGWSTAEQLNAKSKFETFRAMTEQRGNEQPFRTRAAQPPKESDITNIMFLGSRQKLENAFQAAGCQET